MVKSTNTQLPTVPPSALAPPPFAPLHSREPLLHLLEPPVLRLHLLLLRLVVGLQLVLQELQVAELVQVLRGQ